MVMLDRRVGCVIAIGAMTFFAGWTISAYINGHTYRRGVMFDRCYYDTRAGVLTCLPDHLTDEIPE